MEVVHRTAAVDGQQPVDLVLRALLGLGKGFVIGGHFLQRRGGEIVVDGVRQHEISVRQALHERGGAEAVGAVIREVAFPDGIQAGQRRHQVVIHPQAAHGIVDGGIDHHGRGIRIFIGDAVVHLEEVAVLRLDVVASEALNGLGEVEIDRLAGGSDAAPLVAHLLGVARREVARNQVAEAGIFPLEIVIALRFGNLVGGPLVARSLRHPDASVVAQAFGHEGEFRLVFAVHRNAGRMDRRVARIGHGGAPLIGAPHGAGIAVHGVGGEEKDVAVAAGGQHHGVGLVTRQVARHQVARNDAVRLPVDDHDIDHLAAGMHRDSSPPDFLLQCAERTQQELLAGLAAGVEGAGYLRPAEGAVGEITAILARKGNALCNAVVDDQVGALSQPVDIGLTGTEVAPFDRIVEEAVDGVAVVRVILGGVDPALCGNGVRPAGRIGIGEAFHRVSQFGQGGGGGCPGEPGADDDNPVLALVGRIDQFDLELMIRPLLGHRAFGYLCIQFHRISLASCS